MTNEEEDFALIAQLSDKVRARVLERTTDPYEASPFRWIRQQPSATKGAIGALLIREWATRVGLDPADRLSSDHDLRVSGLKIEVKMSTLWSATDFKFQQLRDQDYEYVCMLGLEPQAARLWVVPKEEALKPRDLSACSRGRYPMDRLQGGFTA